MKILYICHTFRPLGGNEINASKVARLMASKGHEVKRLSYDPDDEAEFTVNLPHRSKYTSFLTQLIYDPKVVNQAINIIRKVKPDIIHHQHKEKASTSMGLALGKIKKELNIPIVLTIRGFGFGGCVTGMHVKPDGTPCNGIRQIGCFFCRNSLKGKLMVPITWLIQTRGYGSLFSQVDVFTSVSKAAKKMLEIKGYSPVIHLPNFVDIKDQPVSFEFEKGNILFVGRLHPVKGCDDLIKAMPHVIQKVNARLYILGKGPHEGELKQMVEELGLKNEIIFRGFLQGIDLENEYKKANVVVVPSIWLENSSTVIYEAMSYGRPIVSTLRGGTPELVEDGVTGFLVEPRNPHQLAEKITIILENPDLAIRMGEKARKKAEREYSAKGYGKKLEEIYITLLRNKNKRKYW